MRTTLGGEADHAYANPQAMSDLIYRAVDKYINKAILQVYNKVYTRIQLSICLDTCLVTGKIAEVLTNGKRPIV